MPIKGAKKGFAQIELLVPVFGWTDGKGRNRNGTPLVGKRPRGYYRKDNERVWVNAHNLNEPGDFRYSGPRLKEVVQERKEEKAQQQAKADKRAKSKARTRV